MRQTPHKISIAGLGYIAAVLLIPFAHAQVPQWIWHKNTGELPIGTEEVYLRKSFVAKGPIASAELKAAGDDAADVFLNGEPLGTIKSRTPGRRGYHSTTLDVTAAVRAGENILSAKAKNSGGPRGFIAQLTLTFADGKQQILTTDTTWVTRGQEDPGWEQSGFDHRAWAAALHIGQDGDAPWYEIMDPDRAAAGTDLKLVHGFKAERIRAAGPEDGSWIALAIDDKGRLIVSPQDFISPDFGGMRRFTLDDNGRIAKDEKIMLPVGAAQGLAYGFDALYVQGLGPNDQSSTGILPVSKSSAPKAPNPKEKNQGPAARQPDPNYGILGLYRLRDTDGDDQFDEYTLLKEVHNRGRGSHGPHGLTFGPDGMLYHISGDYSKPVNGIAPDSPHRNYREDLLLPRRWDASGHGRGVIAPCGHVQRTDPDGKNWELFAAGFRNPYDLAFNADGELFTYDADMEYDTGSPWYRPTRVYHVVSGGEYGQRAGTGKWPYYYPDSLPPATDIGRGSPCGVAFGTGSAFPQKYQRALFMADWAFGKIYAVHFEPAGASYTATFETFAQGRPLNAMDIEIGKDGALYFITGGNNTSSALYRIHYDRQVGRAVPSPPPPKTNAAGNTRTNPSPLPGERVRVRGNEPPPGVSSTRGTQAPAPNTPSPQSSPPRGGEEVLLGDRQPQSDALAAVQARDLRHQLEQHHKPAPPGASGSSVTLALAWPHLDHEDRWIRYAARIAIEHQDPKLWHDRALAETRPRAALTALLALARSNQSGTAGILPASLLPRLLTALDRLKWDDLSESQQLELLRVYQVAFARLGPPNAKTGTALAQKLTKHYPASSSFLDREFSQLLIYLDAPGVIEKTLALLDSADTQEQQIHYIFHLRNLRRGWTLPQRKQYFAWFDKAAREYSGGVSFYKFLANFKGDAMATLRPDERDQLEGFLEDFEVAPLSMPTEPMVFVQAWTMDDLEPHLPEAARGRNFANAARAFKKAQCILCHRMFNEGGAIGPDLTAVAGRFSRRDLLESILDPSKAFLEQYRTTTVIKTDGAELTGQLVEESDETVTLVTDALTHQYVEIPIAEIKARRPSDISPMPAGLLNFLTQDEILDLLAYIESAGVRSAEAFKPQP